MKRNLRKACMAKPSWIIVKKRKVMDGVYVNGFARKLLRAQKYRSYSRRAMANGMTICQYQPPVSIDYKAGAFRGSWFFFLEIASQGYTK
mmetsp:Transcript_56137/g.99974  ORF Transcript_56137/g.99974 Transcript_56137/m.99974 type:complete len:90 (-) Transcript_56137:236-505(-)